ncbi:MAG: hypothetical protein ICV63_02035 [Coleofasciculus sp. Co-bin14]|nr:hypothetical protein [Coleofasciculus sp. Co-bin14]
MGQPTTALRVYPKSPFGDDLAICVHLYSRRYALRACYASSNSYEERQAVRAASRNKESV